MSGPRDCGRVITIPAGGLPPWTPGDELLEDVRCRLLAGHAGDHEAEIKGDAGIRIRWENTSPEEGARDVHCVIHLGGEAAAQGVGQIEFEHRQHLRIWADTVADEATDAAGYRQAAEVADAAGCPAAARGYRATAAEIDRGGRLPDKTYILQRWPHDALYRVQAASRELAIEEVLAYLDDPVIERYEIASYTETFYRTFHGEPADIVDITREGIGDV